VLEGHLEVLVVNAQHIKAVPGRKTDMKDAEWMAELLQHGLLRPSFIPPAWQRALRTLTRSRASLTQERSRTIARLQKELEDANIKLAAVASDLMGKSAQQMLQGLLAGEADPATLAEFARGRMRSKRDQLALALTGHLQPHHRVLIVEHLAHSDALEESIARLSAEIAERLRPYEAVLQRLETIPGIKRRLAEIILAEMGPDMQRFPSAQHLARLCRHLSRQPRKCRETLERQDLASAVNGCALPWSKPPMLPPIAKIPTCPRIITTLPCGAERSARRWLWRIPS
jgi:transposase